MPKAIGGKPKKSRKAVKRGPPIGPPRGPEVDYRRRLLELNRVMKKQTALIGQTVRTGAGVAEAAARIERELAKANAAFDVAARDLPAAWASSVDAQNKGRVEGMLRRALGVDTVRLFDDAAIRTPLDLAVADSAQLIKSIPSQHFAKVTQAVVTNYRGGTFAEGGLAARLKKIGTLSDSRAKFLARDQTSKLVANLNEVRQKDAGISGYIWRTAKDERVVGAPGNDYEPSRAHGDHYAREGKAYSWDNPPADGHPGQPIGCRCRAEPVLDISEILDDAVQL